MAKGKFLIYRVERHRFQVVSTAFIKLRAMIGVDLLVFEVQLIGLGLTDVMQQGYNGDGFHLFGDGNSASVPNSFIQLRHMRWKTFRECSTRPPAKLLWNFVLAGASKKSVASNRSNSESEPVLCIYFWYAEMKGVFLGSS